MIITMPIEIFSSSILTNICAVPYFRRRTSSTARRSSTRRMIMVDELSIIPRFAMPSVLFLLKLFIILQISSTTTLGLVVSSCSYSSTSWIEPNFSMKTNKYAATTRLHHVAFRKEPIDCCKISTSSSSSSLQSSSISPESIMTTITDKDKNGQKDVMPSVMIPTNTESHKNMQKNGLDSTDPKTTNTKDINHDDDSNAFALIAVKAGLCLMESDMRRDAIGKSAGSQASSATNWIHDASAFALQQVMNRVQFRQPGNSDSMLRNRDDESASWIRWIKMVPAPLLIDLSDHVRQIVQDQVLSNNNNNLRNETTMTTTTSLLQLLDYASPQEFLQRLFGRLIILPSGMTLPHGLSEPPASIIYGKLLMGGVTRYRLLVSSSSSSSSTTTTTTSSSHMKKSSRRAGERKEVIDSTASSIPVWMQYGGPDRFYEAVDVGTAVILEIGLLPRGKTHVAEHLLSTGTLTTNNAPGVDQGFHRPLHHINPLSSSSQNLVMMSLSQIAWNPKKMLDFIDQKEDGDKKSRTWDNNNNKNVETPMSLYGKDRNDAFRQDFQSRIGGLQTQIDAIVRRVLDGRVIRPVEPGETMTMTRDTTAKVDFPASSSSDESYHSNVAKAAMEAEALALLGLSPVRGLLLYGPPGCGKTALAREISLALRARAPKIVSAPELLDRWVGGSERLVRELFADAEAEWRLCGGDPSQSALHVIVIDEIDAVFRKRSGSTDDSGEATRASAVNQILAKMDGVQAIPNVLLIGMTNRRELLDEALLRPGRLEVQIEIPLPDQQGRREILQIHFDALRKNGRLSRPLCCAIDGVRLDGSGVNVGDNGNLDNPKSVMIDSVLQKGTVDYRQTLAGTRASLIVPFRNWFRRRFPSSMLLGRITSTYDLAADYATGGFSGADIAGLVRCAGSIALSRARQNGNGVEGLLITLEDVKAAVLELKGKPPR